MQRKLDEFCEYWNCHRVRGQRAKIMPSGGTPNDVFANPEAYALEDISIPIQDMGLVHHLPECNGTGTEASKHTVVREPYLIVDKVAPFNVV